MKQSVAEGALQSFYSLLHGVGVILHHGRQLSHHPPPSYYLHWAEGASQDRVGLLDKFIKSLPVSRWDAAPPADHSLKNGWCHHSVIEGLQECPLHSKRPLSPEQIESAPKESSAWCEQQQRDLKESRRLNDPNASWLTQIQTQTLEMRFSFFLYYNYPKHKQHQKCNDQNSSNVARFRWCSGLSGNNFLIWSLTRLPALSHHAHKHTHFSVLWQELTPACQHFKHIAFMFYLSARPRCVDLPALSQHRSTRVRHRDTVLFLMNCGTKQVRIRNAEVEV